MANLLPREFDPVQLAQDRVELNGIISVEAMDRLRPLLALTDTTATVSVVLKFSMDHEHRPYIDGSVSGNLPMICQRCMQLMHYSLSAKFALAPVTSARDVGLVSEEYDALITEGEPVIMSRLIEDELLVALPYIVKHNEIDCSVQLPAAEERAENVAKANNPFAILAGTKQKLRDKEE